MQLVWILLQKWLIKYISFYKIKYLPESTMVCFIGTNTTCLVHILKVFYYAMIVLLI